MEQNKDLKIGAIFIIGLSAAGKTTLADLLVKHLREQSLPCFLLDGCEMNERKILQEYAGHDLESRKNRGLQLINIINWIGKQHILPIAAVIGQPSEARIRWRKKICNYTEIYLKCDIEVCKNRDQKHLYESALHGENKSIVGVDLLFDEPKNSDLVLQSDQLSPGIMLDELLRYLKKLDWFKSYQQYWSN
jgi:adenylylsulfate kinase-like enzyme